MTDRPIVSFASLGSEMAGTLVLLVGEGPTLPPAAEKIDRQMQGALKRAAEAADFKGKARSTIEILGANSAPSARIILLGIGKAGDQKHLDWHRLGGVAYAQIAARNPAAASILVDGTGPEAAEHAAMVAAGAQLRAYNFRKYITRESSDSNGQAPKQLPRLTVHTADPGAATEAFFHREAVAKGVYLARDLVNEPANILGPVEFADRLNALESSGVEVEILAENRLKELKMGALLAVGQGSVRESRVVVMQWHGAKRARNKAPVCIVGKGVCFDTGGISMKPAAGMEDMKGDMGGAGCVAGLMLALAERRAPVNVIGLVGLVENMPSGSATRPGDIVTSMSGQTIEVLNTDAEGRLVLADVLWYAQERFKPRMIVDLATLTGAIMVALGKEHAGLFSNNDKLVRELVAAGEVTGEKVWHMPLGPGYDKLIDSKNADMKNIGGRFGGAITAAQFIQRFIKDKATPWAHLDIAATAFDSSKNDINQSWGSGWGVRLLDQLIAENYEKS